MSDFVLFAKRVGLSGITNFIVSMRALILIPILTKILGVAEYGIWSQMIVTVSFIAPLVILGIVTGMVRFLASEKDMDIIREGFYSTFYSVILINSIFGLIIYIFASEISLLVFGGTAIDIIKIMAFVILFQGLNQLLVNFFRTFERIKKYSFFTIVQTLAEIVFISYSVFNGYGITGAVLSLLCVKIVVFMLMFAAVINEIGILIKPRFSEIRPYFQFGLPLVPSALFVWIVNSSDRYVIGYFMGIEPVGIYSAAYGIGSTILIFLTPIMFILPVTLTKSYDEERLSDFRTYMEYSFKYFLIIAIPAVFGLTILSKQILLILTTSEFIAGGVQVIPIISLSILIFGVIGIISQTLAVVKETKKLGTVWIIAGILNLLLNVIFVPKIGIIGAAIATLITFIFSLLVFLKLSSKYITLEFKLAYVYKIIISSIFMGVIVWFLNPITIINTLFVIALGASIYFIGLILLGVFKHDEVKFFKTLFH